MSDLWRRNQVDVSLSPAVLDRLLGRAARGPFLSLGSVPAFGPVRILLWTDRRPLTEPEVVGMGVVRADADGAYGPSIRELHWPRSSDESAPWRTLERLAGHPLEPAPVEVAS